MTVYQHQVMIAQLEYNLHIFIVFLCNYILVSDAII